MKKEVFESLLKIFALSLLISVIFLTVRLTEERQEIRKKAAVGYVASLNLAPTQVEVGQDESFNLDVILDTGGEAVVGVDVILYFNSNLLEVVDITSNQNTFKTFIPFSLDDWIRINQGDPSRSKIEFGAVTFDQGQDQVTDPVSGVINPLVTITFQARSEGQSTIFFGFEGLGLTRDSNVVVVSGGEVYDILQDPSENDCQVTISGGATVTPSPTPTLILTPTPTPTIAQGKGDLRFKVRFQGVNGGRPITMRVRGILKQNGTEKYYNDNIITENDGSGVFLDMFRDVSPGTYTALIKGPIHLQKNFSEVTVVADQVVDKDWTIEAIKAGDFNNDNKLNIMDFSAILSQYTALSVRVDESNQLYDVDGSGVIDITDIALVLSNYTALEVHGD